MYSEYPGRNRIVWYLVLWKDNCFLKLFKSPWASMTKSAYGYEVVEILISGIDPVSLYDPIQWHFLVYPKIKHPWHQFHCTDYSHFTQATCAKFVADKLVLPQSSFLFDQQQGAILISFTNCPAIHCVFYLLSLSFLSRLISHSYRPHTLSPIPPPTNNALPDPLSPPATCYALSSQRCQSVYHRRSKVAYVDRLPRVLCLWTPVREPLYTQLNYQCPFLIRFSLHNKVHILISDLVLRNNHRNLIVSASK